MAKGKGAFRIEISKEFDDWVAGFERMDHVGPDAAAAWQAGVEVFYEATQEVVHVVTGNLKRSGKASTVVAGPVIVGTIEYDAEYAMDEIMRGGEHDFMQRGYEKVAGVFQSTLLTAIAAQLDKGVH